MRLDCVCVSACQRVPDFRKVYERELFVCSVSLCQSDFTTVIWLVSSSPALENAFLPLLYSIPWRKFSFTYFSVIFSTVHESTGSADLSTECSDAKSVQFSPLVVTPVN